ncbi:MAG TPA: SDR family oxidoreductase [Solirubrobacteraceae bacterium]|nr:SDR family oxidoreductase [Solirubrobacteraceae bacterium]
MSGAAVSARLAGKVALVTGAGSGIGRSSAQRLAAEGATVVVSDLDLDGAGATAGLIEQADGTAKAVALDVASGDQLERVVAEIVAEFGRLDIAHNNAGIDLGAYASLVDTTEEQWERVMSVNLKGVWLSMRAEIPAMTKGGGGSIINTASAGGFKAGPGRGVYNTSKAGVVMLTRAAALESAAANIRVNAVSPGMVRTPALERAFAQNEQLEQRLMQMTPMGRISDPSEIGSVVAFLASDDASFVTGASIGIDGGGLA